MLKKVNPDRPILSSSSLFFGLAIILILVSFIVTVGGALRTRTINLGSCLMKAETALTGAAKAKGLSGRASIDKNYVMLFPFNHEQPYFWMKGMLTSIDIVWINAGKVVKIDANLPLDDGATNYQAPEPIDLVIETAANRAQECGVRVGTALKT